MTPFEIPLSSEPQKFVIQLAGVQYQMRLYWSRFGACWMLDMGTNQGVPLIQGIPLVTGIDLLAQYAHLELGGALVAQTDSNADQVPTFDGLGTVGRLFFVVG